MGVSKNLKKLKNEIVVENQNERNGMLVFTYHGIDMVLSCKQGKY